MFKRFLDGLAFGTGFAIAFVAVWHVVWFFAIPAFYETRISHTVDLTDEDVLELPEVPELPVEVEQTTDRRESFQRPTLEEEIADSVAIALAYYESADDGLERAIITEYLKGGPATQGFEVGDEFAAASYYPNESSKGEGAVIFLRDSRREGYSFSQVVDGRIPFYYDMPVEAFREKVRQSLVEEDE